MWPLAVNPNTKSRLNINAEGRFNDYRYSDDANRAAQVTH
jgi:hypothetical protein